MALTSKTRGKTDDAQDQIAQMREQVDALTQDRITPVVVDFVGRAGTAAATAKGAVQERAQVVSGQVKEQASGRNPDRRCCWMDHWPHHAMTRPAQLAKIAAQAESARLRGMITRIGVRVCFAVVALLLIMGAVVFAHIAAWYWIMTDFGLSFLAAIGILGGVDLLIAIIMGLLASRSGPSRTEREALAIRRRAIKALGDALSPVQLASPLLRLAPNAWLGRRK